ncbi:MAG: ATP-binding cassette domain-containing protein [Nitrososphaerales archaeon]
MPPKVVEAHNLTKIFNKKVKAVDNVNLEIEQGETFGLLGPNGAGKSTMINMLTTILKPSSGTAKVCGYDIIREAAEVRRSIGVVHQEYTADEDLTGLDNILLCAALYGIPSSTAKQRAWELLELVELKDAAKRKVETYSGGMRRRLELACGLISRPTLLFLDEPTLGLDVQTRVAVWNYIKRLKEEYGMTIFMTTHYLEEADAICDRVAIIDHGKILKIGSPNELKSGLGGDIIEISVNTDKLDLTTLIREIKGVKEVKKADALYRIKAERGEEVAPTVIEAMRSRGLTVSKLSMIKPTLDEVYLEYTGRSLRAEQASEEEMMALRRTLHKARG